VDECTAGTRVRFVVAHEALGALGARAAGDLSRAGTFPAGVVRRRERPRSAGSAAGETANERHDAGRGEGEVRHGREHQVAGHQSEIEAARRERDAGDDQGHPDRHGGAPALVVVHARAAVTA